jgi:Putative adhesin
MRPSALSLCAVLFASAAALSAQSFSTHPCNSEEDHGGTISRWFNGEQACEVRTTTFPLVNGRVNVNSMNGGIEVIGQDRQDVALEARVSARGGSQSEAESILKEITIETGATVEAHGPHTMGNRNWSVGYKLLVPHQLAGKFHTMNGGLGLSGIHGDIQGETTNGGLHIENLGGNVNVSTTNGGIKANLDGNTWQGSGLTASTTNGGVSVKLPSNYSAHLVANTTNGGTALNIPNANQAGVHRRSIDTNLGSGGPTISFETTNGGVSID